MTDIFATLASHVDDTRTAVAVDNATAIYSNSVSAQARCDRENFSHPYSPFRVVRITEESEGSVYYRFLVTEF